MIDSKALPELKKHIASLENQLSFFETKVKETPETLNLAKKALRKKEKGFYPLFSLIRKHYQK